VIEPTLLCLRVAARLSGGQLDFSEKKGEFSLGYPLAGVVQRDRAG
jgi:hypothetical protein